MTDRERNRYEQGRRGLDDPYTHMGDRRRQGGQGYDRGRYGGREVDDTDFGYGSGDVGRGDYGRGYGYDRGRYDRGSEQGYGGYEREGGMNRGYDDRMGSYSRMGRGGRVGGMNDYGGQDYDRMSGGYGSYGREESMGDVGRQGFGRQGGMAEYGGQGYGGQSYGQQGDYGGYDHEGDMGNYGDQDFGRGGGYDRQGGYGSFGGQGYGRQGGMGGMRGGYGQQRGQHTGHGPKGYQRSDDRIREDVCEILTQHGGVDAREIEIDVEHGEITLRGTVDSRQAKRMAEDAIENISGVKEVHNQLRVSQVPTGQSGTVATPGMHDQHGKQGMQGSEQQRAVGGGERSNPTS